MFFNIIKEFLQESGTEMDCNLLFVPDGLLKKFNKLIELGSQTYEATVVEKGCWIDLYEIGNITCKEIRELNKI